MKFDNIVNYGCVEDFYNYIQQKVYGMSVIIYKIRENVKAAALLPAK